MNKPSLQRLLTKVYRCFALVGAASLLSLSIPAPAQAITTVRFDSVGTFSVSEFHAQGVTVTGSALLHFLDLNGLGVAGGFPITGDLYVDSGEWVEFNFSSGGATGISLGFSALGNESGIKNDPSHLDAIASDGLILGPYEVVPGTTANLLISSLFDDKPVRTVRFTAGEDGHRISVINFDLVSTVPEPATTILMLIGAAALPCAMRRRRSPSPSTPPC